VKLFATINAVIITSLLPIAAALATSDQGPTVATPIVVRVVASHALALGDPVGGAQVTIKDVETGTILASGQQAGSGGDLRSVMQTPRTHTEQIFSVKGSAAFTTTLQLYKPTWVEIIGEGPLKFPKSLRRASKTVLLYPGKPVGGDGIVLELNGLLVQIEGPPPNQPLGVGDTGTIRATVKMICDCIAEPFGNWDSRKMEIYGEMRLDNRVITKIDLFHQGPKGLFLGNYVIPRSLKGQAYLTLRVVASDQEGVNTGYDEVTYSLVPWEESRDATGREIPLLTPPSP
jgi:hypothetical protein